MLKIFYDYSAQCYFMSLNTAHNNYTVKKINGNKSFKVFYKRDNNNKDNFDIYLPGSTYEAPWVEIVYTGYYDDMTAKELAAGTTATYSASTSSSSGMEEKTLTYA